MVTLVGSAAPMSEQVGGGGHGLFGPSEGGLRPKGFVVQLYHSVGHLDQLQNIFKNIIIP